MTKQDVLDQEQQAAASEEEDTIIDTSKMSEGKRAALEVTEASRDTTTTYPSFAGDIFMGQIPWDLIHPYPAQSDEDRAQGDVFLEQLEAFLHDKVDPDEIDRTGEIPQEVFEGLAALKAFAIKIPTQYGGLGLSQANYCRAGTLLGSYCGNLSALLSAHQSIGLPQPLLVFGTEAQKEKYLTRIAAGMVSAFALTEESVGSDPAKMQTVAEPTEDGEHFIINGEKLWCTNGLKAGVLVVMARTPSKIVRGKERTQITAFIVETDWPGVTIEHRCRFMGLKALYNGVIRFTDVKVPKENIILAEGKGLRVALTTLNTGRLTLPAICAGASKTCMEVQRKWCNEREQWGSKIGKHAAIADKMAKTAASTFAFDSMTMLTAGLVDKKTTDIRLEAAMCKMYGSEAAWSIIDETMQIRGGRGYETADSLRARGSEPIPIERMMRDCRINLIFEGSSEIMRLFIAREALDPHLKLAAAAMNSRLPMGERAKTALKAAGFYAIWYPKLWLPLHKGFAPMDPGLARHARYANRTARKLARSLFHAMARYGPKLESQGILLKRLVDVGTEIFAIAACCSRAQSLIEQGGDREELTTLVDFFVRESKLQIKDNFRGLSANNDKAGYRLAGQILDGKYGWLSEGIVNEPFT